MSHIAILGCGASGLVAAICLAREGFKVTIVEAKPRIGQKLLVTGNGRCNLTNLNITKNNYHSNNPDFVHGIITKYNCDEVLAFFKSIGLYTYNNNGLVYPLSNKASSVLDLLRATIQKYNVTVITDFEIKSVSKTKKEFVIKNIKGTEIQASQVIIATGLNAYTGTDIGLKILKSLGHSCNKTYPALVQLKTQDPFIKGLKGVKVNGKIKIYRNNKIIREERGEILFTEYGISGIAVMQVSYLFSVYDDCSLKLDFLPDMTTSDLVNILRDLKSLYKNSTLSNGEYLTGLMDKKLGIRIIKQAKTEEPDLLAKFLKSMPIKISGPNGMKNAQICGGGAILDDFNGDSLESKHIQGLYAIGEVLDVIGDCGGYNLHWAFATALCVYDAIVHGNVEKSSHHRNFERRLGLF